MADETEANADPSMEEILASIRKIISADEAPVVEPAPEPPAPAPVAQAPVPEEEIIELTQMVQDDGSVIDLTDQVEIVPVPVTEPAQVPQPAPIPMTPVEPLTASEPLISEPAATTAASALSSLASTLEIERLAHLPTGATYLGNGSRTLEDMVIELMRPMLKNWLDQNLPPIVERLVQKEIERIAKRT